MMLRLAYRSVNEMLGEFMKEFFFEKKYDARMTQFRIGHLCEMTALRSPNRNYVYSSNTSTLGLRSKAAKKCKPYSSRILSISVTLFVSYFGFS